MKIAVVAANGKVSQLVIEEALKRGHEVVAFSRSQNRSKAENFVQKDILAMTKEDLTGFDAVVDGFGASTPETLPLHTRT
ncbi:NAD(P)H-binding protein, partial [Streptococcus sobrinus]